MKIAILYICTGKYTIFWERFYSSCERYFFENEEKHYFVFTDGQIAADNDRVHRVEQKNLGWPGNTLYRFKMFSSIKEHLADFDYIFFFNANCEFLESIGTEFLPSEEEEIVVVQHPGFFKKTPDDFTYDRNPKSRAYIPFGYGSHYVCGGVNGGRSRPYLKLIDSLRQNIKDDEADGVVALWHDESHINAYILNHPHKLLPPAYCYPEGWRIPFKNIILIRDKKRYGGHNALRNVHNNASANNKNHKIVVKIKGGLGNQMFQYACGRAAAKRLNAKLYLDLSRFKKRKGRFTVREFLLNAFPNIRASLNSKKSDSLRQLSPFQKMTLKILKTAGLIRWIKDPENSYWPEIENIPSSAYLSGYWQNETYFSGISSDIRQEFSFPNFVCEEAENIARKIKKSPCSLSIHVRRGDYLGNADLNVCSMEYYEKALQIIIDKYDIRPDIFLFSDDPDYLKNNFDTQGCPAVIVDIPQHKDAPYHDMHLMSLCKHHIIANSSFSWWGAWLSAHDGTVIAPKNWFAQEALKRYNPAVESWIKI